jgi:hypothetical protein
MTADVVLVKHYIPEDTEFAYAATLGRMVVFLPGAIVAAMFPKVASRGGGSHEQHRVFLRSLCLTALCVTLAVAGCFCFSGLLAHILFGITDASVYLRQMIGWMSLVMGASALLNVVIQFLLAQRRFGVLWPVFLFSFLYLVSVHFFHSKGWSVVLTAGAANVATLSMLLISCFWCRYSRPAENKGEDI